MPRTYESEYEVKYGVVWFCADSTEPFYKGFTEYGAATVEAAELKECDNVRNVYLILGSGSKKEALQTVSEYQSVEEFK